MTLPSVKISKLDGQTGVVRPSAEPEGIIAIIAASQNQDGTKPILAATYVDKTVAFGDDGWGPLSELAAYFLDTTGLPVVLVNAIASTPGAYGSVDTSLVTGACVVTAHTATVPYDSFTAWVKIIAGGTVGVAGITYQASIDGGVTYGPVTALGTATNITIPNTNVRFDLTAATLNAGDLWKCQTSGPLITSGDLTAALEALRLTNQPWEALIIDGIADPTMVAAVDTWLSGQENVGQYHSAVVNTRLRNIAASESETSYAASLSGTYASTTTTREVLCADAADVISPLRNVFMRRPVGLSVAARGMSIDFAVDAGYVADGALSNVSIKDGQNNPKYHDEQLYPGLDDDGFTTLRSFPGRSGAYVTNARLFSGGNSDYVFWQHVRVMNLACSIAFQVLSNQLGLGVHVRQDPTNPNKKIITEADAQKVEALVQSQFDSNLVPKRASSATFTLSRTDDLSSNGPATVTATIAIGALRYIKTFKVNAKFI